VSGGRGVLRAVRDTRKKETHEASKGPGHVRGGDEARGPTSGAGGLVRPESVRDRIRPVVERTNARLKDACGGHPVRVRGHAKVFGQLMFALLALTVDQIIRRDGKAGERRGAAIVQRVCIPFLPRRKRMPRIRELQEAGRERDHPDRPTNHSTRQSCKRFSVKNCAA